MKRILLTGTGRRGFIGKVLNRALSGEYAVFSPAREELDLLDGEAVAAWLHRHPVDAIVHGAAHHPHHGGGDIASNNIRMFFNLERCRDDYDRLVYFGSGAEYDKRYPLENVTEEEFGASIPVDPYGFAKYVMNKYARGNPRVTNLRLFGVFGPDEDWRSKFITGLCYKAQHGLPLTVRYHCMFDFLYVDDLVEVVRATIDGLLPMRDYNVCTGMPVDIVAIAGIVKSKGPVPVDIELLDERWKNAYTGDNRRLLKDFPGWRITPMEKAIEKTMEHFSQMKNDGDIAELLLNR